MCEMHGRKGGEHVVNSTEKSEGSSSNEHDSTNVSETSKGGTMGRIVDWLDNLLQRWERRLQKKNDTWYN
jgi:hypothetical protein